MARATRTFRIFVSSTFDDLKEERNALQALCFQRLRRLCAEHGTRFQAIDLRWGVPSEAGLDQRTMSICLEEVARCQHVSPRPNFIVLLGDRYGWRPLPEEIDAEEFERLLHVLDGDEGRDDSYRLAVDWYERDDNSVPPSYRLRPRTGDFENDDTWTGVQDRLRDALARAAATLGLGSSDRLKYEASATEQEIQRGALQVEDADKHVLCFFRSIDGMPEGEDTFRDAKRGEPDRDAGERLDNLKSRLGRLSGNVFEYTAAWKGTDHDDPSPITSDHIGQLCEDAYHALEEVIRAELERLDNLDSLEKEVSDGTAFEEDRTRFFTGRTSILETISAYLRQTTSHPLIVHGPPGSGKSAVMARAAILAREASGASAPDVGSDPVTPIVISRYIGATANSADIRALLANLCRQIARTYGAPDIEVPSEYRDLIGFFRDRLEDATAEQPLILFLDGLDQLSDSDAGRSGMWLPTILPDHVRVVVSTLPGDALHAMTRKLPGDALAQLDPMPAIEAAELLDLWLADAGRTLQPDQRDTVLDSFAECPYPFYLRLAREEAKLWRSFTPQSETILETSIPGLIRQLIRRLERPSNHGKVLPHHALGFLAAAKNGLSEDEILDLLSGGAGEGSEVWEDFRRRRSHTPPEQRLPVAVWSRLYFDLEPYLTERSADGTTLLTFYHRQLLEVVQEDMLGGDDGPSRHAELAEYFGSHPLYLDDREPPSHDPERPPGIGVDHTRVANLRKLSELPFQQTNAADRWEALHETLTDFDFIEAKCSYVAVSTQVKGEDVRNIYGGVYELLDDYRRAMEALPSEHVSG